MNLNEAIQSVHSSIDQVVSEVKTLSPEAIDWKPTEDSWSVREVLCHIEELIPYWLDDVAQTAATPGREWGRGLQHEPRLAAIANAPGRNLDEVISAIEASKSNVTNVLGTLSENALAVESPSRNPRFGTKPLSFVIDHLLVEHMEVHLRQIQRNVRQFEESKGQS